MLTWPDPRHRSPPPCGVRLAGGQDAMTHRRQGFGLPVLPVNPVIFQRQLPRRSGPPGVSSGYFQRTIVRYTGLNHLTDRGLYPVLRTRPDLAPPQICLPFTLSDTGHTCTSTHAFASGFLQARISATPLPLAILPLRQGGSGLCPIFVSEYRTSPFSSRAKPGTQPITGADPKGPGGTVPRYLSKPSCNTQFF